MDGLDIALSQAPPIHWLPPNINMRVWNIFEDLPEDPMGQFDIVHVRLLFLVVLNNDAVPVINNLSQMQKPGGYLQWEELNACDHHVVTVGSAVQSGLYGCRHASKSHRITMPLTASRSCHAICGSMRSLRLYVWAVSLPL